MWKWLTVKLAILGTVILSCAPSWGADWAVSPNIEFVEEYNDNILLSRDENELEDFVTYVRPRLEAVYGTERFRLSLDSGLGVEAYLDEDQLDTIDHNHRIALSRAFLPTFSLRAGGYFQEDTTLETELVEAGLLVNREDRRNFGGNIGFDYAFSTRLSISGGWTRQYTEYPENPDDLEDRFSDTLELAPRYALTPRTNLFLNLGYTDTEYDLEGDPSIANYSIMPSFRHDFAQDFYVSGGAGYRYTEDKVGTADEHTDGFIFDLLFHKDWKKVSMEFLGSRDQYTSLDRRNVERDRVTLRGTYQFSTRLRTALSATLRRNRTEAADDDTDYFTVSPDISYDLTSNITLKGTVDYDKYYYDEDSDRDRERFRARLVLNFRWPKVWSGH